VGLGGELAIKKKKTVTGLGSSLNLRGDLGCDEKMVYVSLGHPGHGGIPWPWVHQPV